MQKDVLRKLLLEMKKISDTKNSVFLFVNLKSEISDENTCMQNKCFPEGFPASFLAKYIDGFLGHG